MDWDVWIVDWQFLASWLGFLPPYVQLPPSTLVNAKIAGYQTASFFADNYQYQHYHLIAHSAGSNLIDTMAEQLRTLTSQSQQQPQLKIHETFLDPYNFPPLPTIFVDPSRHLSFYGKSADWVDSYVDTRRLFAEVEDPEKELLLEQLDTTDLHLRNGFNVDVTPESAGCSSIYPWYALCRHARPYLFYLRSIDPAYPADPADTIENTGDMGFLLSMEGGSNMNMLSVAKDQECRMDDTGNCGR